LIELSSMNRDFLCLSVAFTKENEVNEATAWDISSRARSSGHHIAAQRRW
jgi:hypothetical protein